MRVCRYDLADPSFPVSLVEVADPVLPGPGWVRVVIGAGGICGSDLHVVYPDGTGSAVFGPFVGFPLELGHEIAGTVVEAGPDCPVPVGALVAVDPVIACAARGLAACRWCVAGQPSSCLRLHSRAGTPGFGHGFTNGLGAGWSDTLLAHHSQLHVAPAGMDASTAALAEPLSIAVHGMGRRLPEDGAPVLVVGAGIIGLAAVAAARALVPSSPVTVLAKHPHQQAAARRLGAHHVVEPDAAGAYVHELAALSGGEAVGGRDGAVIVGGYTYVVEAVGSGASVGLATRLCAQRGTVLLVGAVGTATVDLTAMWFKELEMVGTFCHAVDHGPGGAHHSIDRALELLVAGALPASSVVTHTFGLDDYKGALATAHDRAAGAIKVQFRP